MYGVAHMSRLTCIILLAGCATSRPAAVPGPNPTSLTLEAEPPVDPLRDFGCRFDADLTLDSGGLGERVSLNGFESAFRRLTLEELETLLAHWREDRRLAVINIPREWPDELNWWNPGDTEGRVDWRDVEQVSALLRRAGFDRVVVQEVSVRPILLVGAILSFSPTERRDHVFVLHVLHDTARGSPPATNALTLAPSDDPLEDGVGIDNLMSPLGGVRITVPRNTLSLQ